MHVSALVWAITLVAMIAIFAVDLLIVGRRPHEPSMRETAIWISVYVALAVAFGAVLFAAYGPRYGGEFFAGWLTEYSLSVDNLFVFVIIMARFAVPRLLQQKVLLIGVMLALLMRGALIAVGAAVVDRFVWVFYLFGAFLIYTAIGLARQSQSGEGEFRENVRQGFARRPRRRLEVPAAEVAAPEAPAAAEVAAAEVAAVAVAAVIPAAVIAAANEGMRRECLSEQEPGEQAGSKAEAAPVRRGEAGVDIADRGAVSLHRAHVGFNALRELVRAGGADGDVAARPAFWRRPAGIAH
jgi:ribosomal protein L25 (general stress protein Ctc)